jgi:PAS domain S-box-containing protein
MARFQHTTLTNHQTQETLVFALDTASGKVYRLENEQWQSYSPEISPKKENTFQLTAQFEPNTSNVILTVLDTEAGILFGMQPNKTTHWQQVGHAFANGQQTQSQMPLSAETITAKEDTTGAHKHIPSIESMRITKLSEMIPLPFIITSIGEGKILHLNNSFCLLTGYSPDNLVGKNAGELFADPDELRQMMRILKLQKQLINYPMRLIRADKKSVKMYVSVRQALLEDTICFVVGMTEATDTVSLPAVGTNNNFSDNLFFENPTAALIIRISDTAVLAINDAVTSLTGYTPADLVGKPFPEQLFTAKIEDWSRIGNKRESAVEVSLNRKDGSILSVRLLQQLITYKGQNCRLLYIKNQSVLKATEIAVSARTQQFRNQEVRFWDALSSAKIVLVDIDIQRRRFLVGEHFFAMLGYAKTGSVLQEIIFEEFVTTYLHSDDSAVCRSALDVFTLKAAREEIRQVLSLRMLHTDGEYRFVNMHLRAVTTKNNDSAQAYAYFQDMTEARKAEIDRNERDHRLRVQEQGLAELAKSEALTGDNLDKALEVVTRMIARTLNVERVGIWLYNETASSIVCYKLYEATPDRYSSGVELFAKDFPTYFAALKNESTINADYATIDPRTSEFTETYLNVLGITSMLDIPIRRNRQMIGVICHEHIGTPRKWLPDEMSFATAVAEMISLSMETGERREAMRRIAAKEVELVQLNQTLQELLRDKTEAIERLQKTQNLLIQAEKMASLGQLIAGVAHEVNTPVSAIKASARNIIRSLSVVLMEVPTLLKQLDERTNELFMRLVNQSISMSNELTTEEERKYRFEIKRILDAHEIENSFELAKELVEIRVIENINEYISLFDGKFSGEILDKVYKLGQFKKNLDNIENAAEKAARVVKALKSYSHMQASEQLIPSSLAEIFDTVLTVLNAQIKYGIAVEKRYEPIPPVPVFPDEIAQVFSNLMSNAIQAMKNKGKLQLSVFQEADFAVAQVTDNGPGIPDDILPRIFEPFFTTKPQGEGTGLGLDICRKIIEKHNGTISVQSVPGQTTFSVCIPLRQNTTSNNNAVA